MYKIIDEGDVKVYVPEEEKVSRSLPVFFNPEMKLNRDIALYIINKLKPERCLDAMAGTGVRALRILKETSCKNVVANDLNPEAAKLIKRNAELNKLDLDVHNKDLNVLLREEQWF
ncbi:MAG: tRNA (guanine(10)-N(2))-dimethyltransferase, partial [Candidatus Woesearchaeota archaeon]